MAQLKQPGDPTQTADNPYAPQANGSAYDAGTPGAVGGGGGGDMTPIPPPATTQQMLNEGGAGQTPPQTNVPPPVQLGQPAPSNVNPDWWQSFQSSMGTNKVAAQIAGMQPGATNNTPTFTGPSAGGGANPWTSYSGNPNDPTQIDNYVKWLMSQPGEDPAVAGDEAYLDQRIAQTGGLTQDNMGYWNGRTKAGVYTAPEAGGSTSSTGQPGGQDIMSLLQSIFSQGTGGKTPSQTNPQLTSYLSGILQNPSSTFNQGLVNTEVMNARDQLEQGKQTGTQSLEAQLAARGLAGSGPETSGLEGLTAQLQNQFGNQVTDIYGKAGDQANSQLASAIAAATGLSEADATNLLSQYEATTQRGVGAAGALNSANQTGLGYAQLDLSKLLGEGSLGLQSNAQDIGLQEFLDTFGLQQQQQSSTQQHTQNQDLLAWIEANFPGAQLAAQGYQ